MNSKIILKKELLELIRDKRVIISAIIVPLLLMPIIMLFLSIFISKQINKVSRETICIGYSDQYSKKFLQKVENSKNIILKKVKNYKQALNKKELDFFIQVEKKQNNKIIIYYDQSKTANKIKYSMISNNIKTYKLNHLKQILKNKHLENLIDEYKIEVKNTASKEKMGASLLALFLPYLLIIISMSGATYVAIDTTVGEKERGTIETLIAAPIYRREIVIGKYLATTIVSLLTTIIMLISVNISLIIFPQVNNTAFHLDLITILIIILSLLPISMLFSALIFSISAISKSIKEAQSYIQPLISIIIIPSMVSLLPGIKQSISIALIPVVNISILIKYLIYKEVNPIFMLITILENLILLVIFIVIAFRSYEKESIIFREE